MRSRADPAGLSPFRLGTVAAWLLFCSTAVGAVDVGVNLNARHTVGGVSTFDRSKFITLHADPAEKEWNHGSGSETNFTDNLLGHFIDGYDVYFGRTTGGITYWLNDHVEEDEDPARPGFSSLGSVQHWGNYVTDGYEGKTHVHQYESKWQRAVVAAQLFPFWPGGEIPGLPDSDRRCGPADAKWDFSTTDTLSEPLGTASGEYMGRYLKYFMAGPGETGQPRPGYYTIVNEPLYWLSDVSSTPPADVFRFHNTCAAEIRDLVPEMKIGGYTTAHPNFEVDNFQRWDERWRTFIDLCGTNMDLWCIHLYDNAGQQGKQFYRKGSNVEATFDMIEHYSQLALEEQKGFAITEYGATYHDYDHQPWTPYRDWLGLKSTSALMMSFMDRPHLMEVAVPFIMLKAEWSTGTYPHRHRLMRQASEMPGETGDHWVYTEYVKFYQLWSEVNGTRVDSFASDPDLQVDAYVDGNRVYVILNNLNTHPNTVDLNLVDLHASPLQSVTVKHLYLNGTGTAPVLEETSFPSNLPSVQVESEATMILVCTYASPVTIDETSDETKHYADTYLRPIVARDDLLFHIDDVPVGLFGEAVLRIGMGRDPARSKQPVVHFNDTQIPVPTDFMGHEGDDRDRFFGVLDIPVPYALIQPSNLVTVTFGDSGGYISSVALRAYVFSRDLRGTGGGEGPFIAASGFVGDDLLLSVSNGVPSGYFDLVASRDLTAAASNWVPSQVGLRFDGAGAATVSHPVGEIREFLRVSETAVPTNPVAVQATFDWEDFAGAWWSDGYNYFEMDNGVTLVAGGRASAHDGGDGAGGSNGAAFKATYWQDETDGTFVMQVGGVDRPFTVTSIDIMGDDNNRDIPAGDLQIRGLLEGVEQWSIDPVEDDTFHTYTSATTGDLSLPVDQIIWHGPYDPDNPSTVLAWQNKIDNLAVEVTAP